jgi:hypothetical protein
MISLEDARWLKLTGGYRTAFDPRPLIKRLETDSDTTAVWQELWEELHHQGDVGDASFAAVPFVVENCLKRGGLDWNPCAMVATIELARNSGKNPEVPHWIAEDYFQAIRRLAEIGASEVLRKENVHDIRAILSVIAMSKGLRSHAKFLLNYAEDELIEIESRALA